LDVEAVLKAAKDTGCEAVFPGYGFLAENPDFVEACEREGLVFIGPPARVMRLLGDKISARKAFKAAGLPVVPGLEEVSSPEEIKKFGEKVGYPLIIKAAAGGGGKGMRKVTGPAEVDDAFEAARSVAKKAFGDDRVYVEKFIEGGRHIEFQFLVDGKGNAIHLGERECSIQRHHQKLIEEAPSTYLFPAQRKEIGNMVARAMREIGYVSAGTMEFLFDEVGNYYALEVNARIQVEHTVTEMISGIDIIRKMIRIAAGESLRMFQEDVVLRGHAIQCRINAEDPKKNFAPSFGKITFLRQVSGPFVRTESGIYQGWTVPPFYDSLLSKICAVGKDRATAIQRMKRALMEYELWGIKTTIPLLKRILEHPDFVSGELTTTFIDENFEVLTDYVEEEEEVFKVAHFIAEVSALGKNPSVF
ncbi:MAG: ATP-grasp domain-containing protein, partial [Deltaproteobacteria bacterium]